MKKPDPMRRPDGVDPGLAGRFSAMRRATSLAFQRWRMLRQAVMDDGRHSGIADQNFGKILRRGIANESGPASR